MKLKCFCSDGNLIVYNVTDSDAGMYECAADNGRERKTAEAKFSVRDIQTASVASQLLTSPASSLTSS